MLSITLAILALYALELAKIGIPPLAAFVFLLISASFAVVALLNAVWRQMSGKG